MTPKTFTIVVPVYQNEANLPDTIPRLLDLQHKLEHYDLNLVFVDDGSTDQSLEILINYAKLNPGTIRVVKLTRNFGQTSAVQAGLYHAKGDIVGIISADLQEAPEVFVQMVSEWENGAKFVIGERSDREEGRLHRWVSGIYWHLIKRFAFPDFPTLGYDLCLLDRQVVNDINRINEKNTSIFVLLFWLGYEPIRLPIVRRLRDKGTSQWRLLKKISFTIDTLIGFTYFPARAITLMGFSTAVSCLLYLFAMLLYWFLFQTAPPGWMSVVGLLTLLGAMLLFSLGIVSEYLLRILDETRKRPPFVVDCVDDGLTQDDYDGCGKV